MRLYFTRSYAQYRVNCSPGRLSRYENPVSKSGTVRAAFLSITKCESAHQNFEIRILIVGQETVDLAKAPIRPRRINWKIELHSSESGQQCKTCPTRNICATAFLPFLSIGPLWN